MEGPFALANLSVEPGGSRNLSAGAGPRWAPGGRARAAAAGAVLLLALLGNCAVLRRRRLRGRAMDFLVAHLALADLCGCALALAPRVAAEARGAGWARGAAACRLLPLLRGCGALASAHGLLLLALERRRPALPALRRLAALGWLLAPLLALPHAFAGRAAGPRCRSVLEERPRWHGLAFAAYAAATGFVAPACVLGCACGRMARAAWAARGRGAAAGRPGPARARTLQLTLLLLALFALCRLPRCALELGLAAAPAAPRASREALAALHVVAAANSALNPFACLLFQSRRPWARRLQRRLCPAAACCPGLEAEPRRRAAHRAPHRRRPRARASPGAATAGPDTRVAGPAVPGAAVPEPAIGGAAVPGAAAPPPGSAAAAESCC